MTAAQANPVLGFLAATLAGQGPPRRCAQSRRQDCASSLCAVRLEALVARKRVNPVELIVRLRRRRPGYCLRMSADTPMMMLAPSPARSWPEK